MGRGRAGSPNGLGAGVRVVDSASYYQALAYEKLGQHEKAKALYAQLAARDVQPPSSAAPMQMTDPSTAAAQRIHAADIHYLAGLGELGLGDTEKAKQEFTLALQASPDHLAAKVALEEAK